MKRKIVYPGQVLSENEKQSGTGTYVQDGKVYSLFYGVANDKNHVTVVPFSGKYIPSPRDYVIGYVIEVTSSNWIFDIGSPYDGLLHVSEYPKRVDSSMMRKEIGIGDCAILRIKDVNTSMKVELSMKDRGLRRLDEGRIIDVSTTKVPRIIGHNGSMVSMLKKESNCDIFIGQNGRIWLKGKDEDMNRLTQAIEIIENKSHISGLTNHISAFLRHEESDEIEEKEKPVPFTSSKKDYTEDACRKVDVLLSDEDEN
jgi:exosome complex component RRP4